MTTPPTTSDMPWPDPLPPASTPREQAGRDRHMREQVAMIQGQAMVTTTDLPAGPELDLEVAKACGIDAKMHLCIACRQRQDRQTPVDMVIIPGFDDWKPFTPSTNISDAFEALGVMQDLGWSYLVESFCRHQRCVLRRGVQTIAESEGETHELSICRAIARAGRADK